LELIGTIALAVLAVVGAAVSTELSDEFKAWSPWIVRRIIQRAARQLPEGQRERFEEEWHAHISEIPGDFGKIIVAFGFLSAARKISSDLEDNNAKRVFDIAFSVIAIAILAPLFVVAAAAIKIDSPGPIFFRQPRYGYNNKIVKVFKFRTMAVSYPHEGRVTAVGRLLRRTNVDEIPQLFNVLMGEMSIVGLRPFGTDSNDTL
jgi:Bacterial sugar transferase